MSQIPENEWQTIVENVPVVSVDLIVERDGEFLLGKRENEPAKELWFVPGGRIHKNETVYEAVTRQGKRELGCSVTIEEELGWYEHFYDSAEVDKDLSKHYLAVAFVVSLDNDEIELDDQHSETRWFSEPPKATHEYTRVYLKDAKLA